MGNSCADERQDLQLISDLLDDCDVQSSNLIAILQKIQGIYGYLPLSAMQYLAQRTGIKAAKIYGVATFYKQFRLTPIGKYVILLCKGTACHVNGAGKLEDALSEELGIKSGETTSDGLFTLNSAACLGCCSLAPVMMINDQVYGELTPKKARQIVRKLAKKESSIQAGEAG
ncbi:MAG: NADH-quinone oxidoreductase subunit NuoE [Syntrophaceticus sp.]